MPVTEGMSASPYFIRRGNSTDSPRAPRDFRCIFSEIPATVQDPRRMPTGLADNALRGLYSYAEIRTADSPRSEAGASPRLESGETAKDGIDVDISRSLIQELPAVPLKIALMGAAGKMGTRISRSLQDESDYDVLYVEGAPPAEESIRKRGDRPSPQAEAVPAADVVIMAVPDRLIPTIAAQVVPAMRAGAMLVCLDPAAPYAGVIPARADIAIFVCHPCHPSVFNEETDMAARFDFFGSGKARQAIVCALLQGTENDYAAGQALAAAMWKPVLRCHRVTVEQMALLEPVMSETVAATCITIIREAMDEAVRRGVPADAARDFLLGHVFCELGIVFEKAGFPFSDGAKKAIAEAKTQIFQPDWKKVFEPAALRESVRKITGQQE